MTPEREGLSAGRVMPPQALFGRRWEVTKPCQEIAAFYGAWKQHWRFMIHRVHSSRPPLCELTPPDVP